MVYTKNVHTKPNEILVTPFLLLQQKVRTLKKLSENTHVQLSRNSGVYLNPERMTC